MYYSAIGPAARPKRMNMITTPPFVVKPILKLLFGTTRTEAVTYELIVQKHFIEIQATVLTKNISFMTIP